MMEAMDDDDDQICVQALLNMERENDPMMQEFIRMNALTCLKEYGFNNEAGKYWTYPVNVPERKYQFDIANTALYNNTLIILPSGLGKGFIASVVLLNLAQWYPSKQMIFIGTTLDNVKKRYTECLNGSLSGIDQSKVVAISEESLPQQRKKLWEEKRLLFLTPQVLSNDIDNNYVALQNIRCIILDQADKTFKNDFIKAAFTKLSEKNKFFRVLALSTTFERNDSISPEEIFRTFYISRMEVRTKDSPDILPYITANQTIIKQEDEHFVVKLDGYAKHIHDNICEVFFRYLNDLLREKALSSTGGLVPTQRQLSHAKEAFNLNPVQKLLPSHKRWTISTYFDVCIELSAAIEILNTHGIISFYKCMATGVLAKTNGNNVVNTAANELRQNRQLEAIMLNIEKEFDIAKKKDAKQPCVNFHCANYSFTSSHPKLPVLETYITDRFKDCSNKTTKAIILSKYKESVLEIGEMLSKSRHKNLNLHVFIDDSKMNLKQDIINIKSKKEEPCNVYVASVQTIEEEWFQVIGKIDLVVCFDASTYFDGLFQQMREKWTLNNVHVLCLVTNGKEEENYVNGTLKINQTTDHVATNIDPLSYQSFLVKLSARMVPAGFEPTCIKVSVPKHHTFDECLDKEKSIQKEEDSNNTISTDEELNEWLINTDNPDLIGASLISHSTTELGATPVGVNLISTPWKNITFTTDNKEEDDSDGDFQPKRSKKSKYVCIKSDSSSSLDITCDSADITTTNQPKHPPKRLQKKLFALTQAVERDEDDDEYEYDNNDEGSHKNTEKEEEEEEEASQQRTTDQQTDSMSSFIDDTESQYMTHTQHAMYIQPFLTETQEEVEEEEEEERDQEMERLGGDLIRRDSAIAKRQKKYIDESEDDKSSSYDTNDSFCVDDSTVDYETVGDFTQAMDQANINFKKKHDKTTKSGSQKPLDGQGCHKQILRRVVTGNIDTSSSSSGE